MYIEFSKNEKRVIYYRKKDYKILIWLKFMTLIDISPWVYTVNLNN